ncbi:MAG: cytidylate kinase-like family protein [Synergistaceae bacterium]|jgi:cytidylate kinase|nr:cytidylate kinase-like family protein [Synergistaceae bacterium]
MDNLVITISREFGSGGRQVGAQLAEKLGVAFYDRALIHLASVKSGLAPQVFDQAEEEATSKFLFNLAIGGYVSTGIFSQINVPICDQVFFAQSKTIEEIAEKESCVIIGRCANYILRDHPGLVRVFVHGDAKDRLQRSIDEYGIPEDEAKTRLSQIDKGRKNYYEHYTNEEWGVLKSYDLAVNTSFAGIDGAVKVVGAMVESRSGVCLNSNSDRH